MDDAFLLHRLAALEQRQRRIQTGAAALFCLLSAFVLMGQAGPSPSTLTVRELVIVDATGTVKARIGGAMDNPAFSDYGGIDILDAHGEGMMHLKRDPIGNTTFSINPPGNAKGGIAAWTRADSSRLYLWTGSESHAELSTTPTISHLRIGAEPMDPNSPFLKAPFVTAEEAAKRLARRSASLELNASAQQASLSMEDSEGFEATLGNVGLQTQRTGGKSYTSAASMVLFGSDKTLLWRAP